MQKIKLKTHLLINTLGRISPKNYAIAWALSVSILSIGYSLSVLLPKKITYNFSANQTCYTNPVLLPRTFSSNNSIAYRLNHQDEIKIGSYPVFSRSTCIELKSMVHKVEKINLSPLGNSLFAQTVHINLEETPKLSSTATDGLPTSTLGEVKLKFEKPDKTFTYKVRANNKEAICENASENLVCKLSPLSLAQSKKYELEFDRYLNEQKIDIAHKTIIQTVDPIKVIEQSIAQNSLIYDKPTLFAINTNKELTSFKNVALINKTTGTEIKSETKIDGTRLIINFLEALPREATFEIKIEELISKDMAFLPSVFVTNFQTSGGPKVAASNISSYGESQYKNFVLNFDTQLLPNQNIASFIAITGPKGAVAFTASQGQNNISIKPISGLDRCTNYIISLAKGIKNAYGIESQNSWSTSTRTICQEVFSIGTSVQGRSITAYKFGNGPSKTIFVGNTHGDEYGSKYLLDSWVNDLEANYGNIPSNRTIYVIPMLNPDAFVVGSRTNANNVDLNRNFPANNWKADVTMPGGNLVINGGGTTALSEPESAAIANFILAHKPELVLTYHSKGSLVVANESGDSVSRAQTYGAKSGYWARKESDLGTTFAYDTTGAMENWLHDKQGIPTLLIELSTHTSNEFWNNKSAMWAMIN